MTFTSRPPTVLKLSAVRNPTERLEIAPTHLPERMCARPASGRRRLHRRIRSGARRIMDVPKVRRYHLRPGRFRRHTTAFPNTERREERISDV